MKTQHQRIPLGTSPSSDRLVKRGALLAFKAVRAVTHRAKGVPGILSQAATDVRDAWAETERPNVQ